MKDYYFRYIVTGDIEKEYTRFRQAIRFAEKHQEIVYLTSFSKSNTYNEPYDEVEISEFNQIKPARKKLIASFYKLTGTQPMSRKDYTIAYKFLKIRATESGVIEPFRTTIQLPDEQCRRIYKFLSYNHQVKFI